jgi:hypothetical protein
MNPLHLCYKIQSVIPVQVGNIYLPENHTKHIHVPCEQSVEFLNVKRDVIKSSNNYLKDKISEFCIIHLRAYFELRKKQRLLLTALSNGTL